MTKPLLFAIIASFGTLMASTVAANEAAEPIRSSSDMVTIQYSLKGCGSVPPNGYITTGKGRGSPRDNCGKDAGGVYNFIFNYESYFDKPVGAQIALCVKPPAQLPNGWFELPIVGSCGIGSPEWKIQRFF